MATEPLRDTDAGDILSEPKARTPRTDDAPRPRRVFPEGKVGVTWKHRIRRMKHQTTEQVHTRQVTHAVHSPSPAAARVLWGDVPPDTRAAQSAQLTSHSWVGHRILSAREQCRPRAMHTSSCPRATQELTQWHREAQRGQAPRTRTVGRMVARETPAWYIPPLWTLTDTPKEHNDGYVRSLVCRTLDPQGVNCTFTHSPKAV